MPPSPFKKVEFTLRHADAHSMLVKVTCYRCRTTHLYFPADVITLAGDIPLDEVATWFNCAKCQTKEYLRADWKHVYSPDVGQTKVRRLVRIRYVRVPIWKEEIV